MLLVRRSSLSTAFDHNLTITGSRPPRNHRRGSYDCRVEVVPLLRVRLRLLSQEETGVVP